MTDPILGPMRPSDQVRALAKAAEKLGIPMPSGADIWPHQCRMGRAAARMSRKQLAAASGVSERTITAFEHHTSRSITRANNVALRRALEAANVGFTGFGIEVPDRRVPVPPTDEARVERVAEAIYLASKDVPRVWLALGRNHRGSWRKLAVAAIAAY